MQANSPQPMTVEVPKPERSAAEGGLGEVEQLLAQAGAHHGVAGQHEQRDGDQREGVDAFEQGLADQRERQRLRGGTAWPPCPGPWPPRRARRRAAAAPGRSTDQTTAVMRRHSSNIALPAYGSRPAQQRRPSRATMPCTLRSTISAKPIGTAASNQALLTRSTGVVRVELQQRAAWCAGSSTARCRRRRWWPARRRCTARPQALGPARRAARSRSGCARARAPHRRRRSSPGR
jgi:hypothetical protein